MGISCVMSSRLIPPSVLETAASRKKFLDIFEKAEAAEPMSLQFYAVTPIAFDHTKDTIGTSVTPTWRKSVYHVIYVSSYAWNVSSFPDLKFDMG